MADLTPLELVLGALASLGLGGSATAIARRKPGSADDDSRLPELDKRVATLETRMSTLETTLAQSMTQLRETTERIWRGQEAQGEKLDKLDARLTKFDIKTTIDRALRRHGVISTDEDTDP